MDHKDINHLKEQKKDYLCPVTGCGSGFAKQYELRRHERTVHMDKSSGKGYRCIVEGCKKPDKIWTRLDNFKKHLGKHSNNETNSESVDNLVKKSARSSLSEEASLTFVVITKPELQVPQKRPAESDVRHPAFKFRFSHKFDPDFLRMDSTTNIVEEGPRNTETDISMAGTGLTEADSSLPSYGAEYNTSQLYADSAWLEWFA
jgi:hypothetical protein